MKRGFTLIELLVVTTGTLQQLAPGANLNARMAIEGDFNNTGVRNINQVPQMMLAVANPAAWAMANHGGQVGPALGNAAVPEILGDFNGDGNFDARDIRYFADGLAIAASGPHVGNLDRKAGFTAVDMNWTVGATGHPAGNYFNTTLATPNAYAAGDSRGDIAGSSLTAPDYGATPGAGPSGADGKINALDIDYEMLQIEGATGQVSVKAITPGTVTEGSFARLLANATTSTPAPINVRADLSADMTGDLNINKDDLDDLVQNILGTQYGDINLDGKVDGADYTIWADHYLNNLGTPNWQDGDLNGDGIVDGADYTIWADNYLFGYAPLAAAAAPALSTFAVPEPTAIALFAVGLAPLLRRRRRTA